PEKPAPDFNTHIAPLFTKYCVACHGADDPEHGLVLSSYDALLKGGEGGAALVPGKGDESRLIQMLDGRKKPQMPPEGSDRPSADEIALIKSWIDAGAKSPTGAAPDPTLLVTPKVKLLAPPRKAVNAAAWSPDGKLIALAGYGEVRLISAESRGLVRRLSGARGNVTDVEFTADGKTVIAASGEPGLFGEVVLFEVATGSSLSKFVGHRDSLYAATASPDGRLIATGSYDQQIKLWDAASGKEVRTLTGHNGAVFDLAFSPDGKRLASASADRSVKVWDVTTGERLDTFGQPLKEVYTVAFSPNGRQIVAGGVDNRIRVWELSDTAKEGTNTLKLTRFAHEGAVCKLVFSADGRTLASAAEDRTVKIWDAPAYTERRALPQQSDWPAALALAPDNQSLLVGRLDGSVGFYSATTGEVVPPAKPEALAISPRGVQRGVTTRVMITGKNLLEPDELKFNRGEIVAKLAPQGANATASDTVAFFDVTPPADLPRGRYQTRLTTPGGATEELPIEIEEIPQLAETEPNDQPPGSAGASQAPTALPASIWGTLAAKGDIDHVTFDAQPGQTLIFDLEAKRLGSPLNAVLTLLNPAGQVVANSNDFGDDADPLLTYRVTAPGRYTIRVRDLALAGSDKHTYRLTAGELPLVVGLFPLSLMANQAGSVELVGYNLPQGARVEIPPSKPGELDVPIDGAFRSRGSLKIVIDELPAVVESEPNDQPQQATAMTAPGVAGGRIVAANHGSAGSDAVSSDSTGAEAGGDADLFRFESKAGQTWIIETEAGRRGSPLDSKIEVLDAAGRPVERVLLQAVRDSYIEFRPVDSVSGGFRAKNWEEMELNEYIYLQGEVCKVFRMPQGPDSEMIMYTSAGKRRGYFDTTATTHPLDENIYTVEPHPPGAKLLSTGLPVFTLYYANDDDGERKLGRDSRLTFTAPAEGAYLVRVTDVRGAGGPAHAYRLVVREPRPDFQVRLRDTDLKVPAGSGQRLTFAAERSDDFDGDITIDVIGLPAGFSLTTPNVIQAGHNEARGVLTAALDAPAPTAEALQGIKITAKAQINNQWVTHEVNSPKIAVGEKPKLIVRLEPADVTIAPGTTVTAQLKIERNGFDGLATFDVDNLPHGVIVDNIGLNGVLIPAGQNERQIFLTAAKWIPEGSRKINAVANAAGTQASAPITLHVRRGVAVAGAAK
ncbi:MAG TPA: c-type cytochrome domain-containing protein, partial [Pirellulales bacterium]